MKHLTEIVAIVCISAFFGLVGLFAIRVVEGADAIGVECVKAGGEWLRNWGQYECVRSKP